MCLFQADSIRKQPQKLLEMLVTGGLIGQRALLADVVLKLCLQRWPSSAGFLFLCFVFWGLDDSKKYHHFKSSQEVGL